MHFMWSSVNVRYFGRQWQSQDFSSEGSKLKNNVKQQLIKKKCYLNLVSIILIENFILSTNLLNISRCKLV
jgi:hypothetical protein